MQNIGFHLNTQTTTQRFLHKKIHTKNDKQAKLIVKLQNLKGKRQNHQKQILTEARNTLELNQDNTQYKNYVCTFRRDGEE